MSGRGLRAVLLFLFLATLSAAWPWPPSLENIDALILRRQEQRSSSSAASTEPSTESSASATGPSTHTSTSDNGKSTITSSPDSDSAAATSGGSAAATSGGSNTATTGTSRSRSSKTTTHQSKTTAIDPRLPPGGIEMVTPAAIAPAIYYKIGDYVTFAWNYTSLSVTPTAIDVLASCSVNNQLYTISANMTVTNATQAVTWDTNEYQATATVPLLTETYTLVIYDAAKDITSIPSAGFLSTFEQWTFGMYVPQQYTPLNEFKCATCSGALSDHERQALGLLAVTSAITILSFTWFANGFGAFS